MFTVPARTQLPRELNTGTGAAWLSEGAPLPVVNNAFATASQDLDVMGVISVFSKELARVNPFTEAIIRRISVNNTAGFEGLQFLDSSITLIAANVQRRLLMAPLKSRASEALAQQSSTIWRR